MQILSSSVLRRAKNASFVVPLLFGVLAAGSSVHAQTKMIEFSEMATGPVAASPTVAVPSGATGIRQISAPLGEDGDSVVLNIYKKAGDIFVDAMTGKSGQAPLVRNHVRLKSPLPIRVDKMTVTMRYLFPDKPQGIMLICSDDSADVALTMPKGFGGTAYQTVFLTTVKGIRRNYDFTGNDSRGYAIVKSSVESTGTVKPSQDVRFFVWSGKDFVPRKAN